MSIDLSRVSRGALEALARDVLESYRGEWFRSSLSRIRAEAAAPEAEPGQGYVENFGTEQALYVPPLPQPPQPPPRTRAEVERAQAETRDMREHWQTEVEKHEQTRAELERARKRVHDYEELTADLEPPDMLVHWLSDRAALATAQARVAHLEFALQRERMGGARCYTKLTAAESALEQEKNDHSDTALSGEQKQREIDRMRKRVAELEGEIAGYRGCDTATYDRLRAAESALASVRAFVQDSLHPRHGPGGCGMYAGQLLPLIDRAPVPSKPGEKT